MDAVRTPSVSLLNSINNTIVFDKLAPYLAEFVGNSQYRIVILSR